MDANNLASALPPAAFKFMLQIVSKYNIDEPLRLAHFLAQLAHESGNFTAVVENLNYSSDGLLKTFPKYFKDRAIADRYARKPQQIGSRVYANRMGNGNEASGDGFKFRGRGYLQLTGKDNYKAFSAFIGQDCVADPTLVANKYPMDSAVWFFDVNKIWDICDKGAGEDVVKAVTRKVNGGLNGIADRLQKFNLYNNLLV
jgi:putative chitinase